MLRQKLIAELIGTAALLMIVVGSGIMGEALSGGNVALALLANSLATGAGLYVLINVFGEISGSHLNPAVSFAEWRAKRISLAQMLQYVGVQILGALAGVALAHAMFGQKLLQISSQHRSEFRFYLAEVIAACGLVLVIQLLAKRDTKTTAMSVALYITAAYWFTSSTSFANPAVTVGRMFTDTFSGIAPDGVLPFIAAQFLGAMLALAVAKLV